MERLKPIFFVGIFILFGSVALSRYSSAEVRAVDAIGLFASGMGCGAALFGFISALRARTKA
jgi:hypothetical protein